MLASADFLTLHAQPHKSLQTLNRSLWAWIEGEYHNTPHRGIEGRTPLEQWALASAAVRYSDATLDLDKARTVNADHLQNALDELRP